MRISALIFTHEEWESHARERQVMGERAFAEARAMVERAIEGGEKPGTVWIDWTHDSSPRLEIHQGSGAFECPHCGAREVNWLLSWRARVEAFVSVTHRGEVYQPKWRPFVKEGPPENTKATCTICMGEVDVKTMHGKEWVR